MKKIYFEVQGMSCGGCSSKVEKSLNQNSDIKELEVSWQENFVKVTGEDSLSNMTLKKEIEGLGFQVTGMKSL